MKSKYRCKRHIVVQPPDQTIRLIPLTQGYNAIVDASDYDWLNQWNWCIQKKASGIMYAIRKEGTRLICMHQLLTNFVTEQVDHADRDGLNNRRSNLRPCSKSENLANQKPRKQFKGVYPNRYRWKAMIGVDRQWFYLGTYATPELAALAYDRAAIQRFGKFARLNFPTFRDLW